MECLKCGYPKARYVVSRKHLWGGHKGKREFGAAKSAPRTDFRVKCPKCGAAYEDDSTKTEVLSDEV